MDSAKKKDVSQTPATKVIGWLVLFFSFLVMAFGYQNSQINKVFWVGCAMIPVGIVFLLLGRQGQKS